MQHPERSENPQVSRTVKRLRGFGNIQRTGKTASYVSVIFHCTVINAPFSFREYISLSLTVFPILSYQRRNCTVPFTVSLLSLNAVKVLQECAKKNVTNSQGDFFQLELKQISCYPFSKFLDRIVSTSLFSTVAHLSYVHGCYGTGWVYWYSS